MKKILLISLLLIGCNCKPEKPEKVRENFVRLFMHEPGRYTVFVKRDNQLITIGLGPYNGSSRELTIFTDVNESDPMYYESEYSNNHYDIKVHIHSEKDVNGGGWNYGKFGTGTTEVIE